MNEGQRFKDAEMKLICWTFHMNLFLLECFGCKCPLWMWSLTFVRWLISSECRRAGSELWESEWSLHGPVMGYECDMNGKKEIVGDYHYVHVCWQRMDIYIYNHFNLSIMPKVYIDWQLMPRAETEHVQQMWPRYSTCLKTP